MTKKKVLISALLFCFLSIGVLIITICSKENIEVEVSAKKWSQLTAAEKHDRTLEEESYVYVGIVEEIIKLRPGYEEEDAWTEEDKKAAAAAFKKMLEDKRNGIWYEWRLLLYEEKVKYVREELMGRDW